MDGPGGVGIRMDKFWSRLVRGAAASVLLGALAAGGAQASATRAYISACTDTADLFSCTEQGNEIQNSAAMSAAFGSDWDHLNFGATDFSGYRMLYIDGYILSAPEMASFLSANRAALEAYVLAGGRLFINAALPDGQVSVDTVFGARLLEDGPSNGSSSARAVDGSNSLFTGAGTDFAGFFFAQSSVDLAAGYSALLLDEVDRVVLAGGFFGSGYAMIGGQTNVGDHDGLVNDPFQLRVNELLYADTVIAPVSTGVPEPGSLALLLAAGLAFAQGRRIRRA